MELIYILRILRRWLWLIGSLTVLTVLALLLGLRATPPAYEATVKLQISTPQREDVAAFDQYQYISLRDEITVARNNLTQVLESDEVRTRTVTRLALEGQDTEYALDVLAVQDADFFYVTVGAQTPGLAAEIANGHVDSAIAYYGELRAKPTNAEKDLFAKQLRIAEEEFRAAEDTFAEFQAEHGIASLEDALTTQQKLLEQLQLERDRLFLEETSRAADPVGEVDKLIAQRQKELERLTALLPAYQVLTENARQAREEYLDLLAEYGELEPGASSGVATRLLETAPITPSAAITVTLAATQTHTIAPGETLSGIASRFGVSAEALAATNGITQPTSVRSGQVLVIPAPGTPPTQVPAGELQPELQAAEERLRAAEDALNQFRAQHGIFSLEDELATYQKLLEQLLVERDQSLLEETTRAMDPVGEVDKLIAQRQTEMDRLAALAPRYDLLAENAQKARESYQHVLNKYAEAELKAEVVAAANFIQIVELAEPPTEPVSDWKKMLVLAVVGSLGLGVVLAFVLEYLSAFKTAKVAASAEEQEDPAAEGQERSHSIPGQPTFTDSSVR